MTSLLRCPDIPNFIATMFTSMLKESPFRENR